MHPLPPSINDPRYAIPVPNRPPVQPAVNLNNPAPPIPLVQPAVVPQPEAAPPQIQTVQPPADPRGAKRQRENDGPDANEPVLKAARTGDMTTSLATQQKALIAAIVDGNPEAVQALLKEQPAMRDGYLPIEYQLTPLCLAARRGSLAIVGLLIRAGAAVDQRAGNGSTPLMFAAQSGHLEVVKLLLLLQAAPEATNSLTGWTALAYACDEKQLEVCKHLISVGCDIWRNLATSNETTAPSLPTTPYIIAIKQDFASLIELLLDSVGMFAAIDPSSRNSRLVTSLSAASTAGSLSIVRMLIARGAKPDVQTNFGDGVIYKDAFHLAMAFDQAHVVEYLLSTGYRPTGWGAILPETHKLTSNPRIVDLILHWQEAANPFSDGLADATIRDQPYRPIMEFAGYLASGRPGIESVAIDAWRHRGQLISMFGEKSRIRAVQSAEMMMKNGLSSMSVEQPLPNHPYGQTLHLLTEMLSEEICAPDNRDPFSGLKLTPQTEAKMNTMHALQSQLMLKGIAYLRAQFEEQLATLPDICMNTYISRSDRLNEPDLYRKMTHDWGLYDPVAKAVLRLVREAYGKLRSLPPEKSTPEFKALSPAEQLRQVIANMLTEWDKIDEIVAELRETMGDDNETVHELLFAQWRQLCEVFNVEKERFVLFGPKRPSADDAPETRIPFLDMDVDPGTKPH